MYADVLVAVIVAGIILGVTLAGRRRFLADDRDQIARLIALNKATPRPGMSQPDPRFRMTRPEV